MHLHTYCTFMESDIQFGMPRCIALIFKRIFLDVMDAEINLNLSGCSFISNETENYYCALQFAPFTFPSTQQ